jgi:fructose-1,6-bisphosphatase
MLASGYCFYGQSTILVLAIGNKVNGYTLDTEMGEFFLNFPNIKVARKSCQYGIDHS